LTLSLTLLLATTVSATRARAGAGRRAASAASRLGSNRAIRGTVTTLAGEGSSYSAESESSEDLLNARLLAIVLGAARRRSGVFRVIVTVVPPARSIPAASSGIAGSSTSSDRSGVVCVSVAVVVVVSGPAAGSAPGTAWGGRVFVVIARPAVVTGGRRRELARDVLDAVVAATKDEIARAGTFATLDVCFFAHEVGLVTVALAGAGAVVATRLFVIAVG
jgi:hypothetical protein